MIKHSFGIAVFAFSPANQLGAVNAIWPNPSESLVKTPAQMLPELSVIQQHATIRFVGGGKDGDTSFKFSQRYDTSIQKAHFLNLGIDIGQQSVEAEIQLAQATPDDKPFTESLPLTDLIWVQVRQPISLEEVSRQLRIDPALLARLNLVESNHRFRQGEWLAARRQLGRRVAPTT